MKQSIQSKLVAEEKRSQFLTGYFGDWSEVAENCICHFKNKLCKNDCSGDAWRFYELSNGGFYLAPTTEKIMISGIDNGYIGELSAEAAGIILTLHTVHAIYTKSKAKEKKCYIIAA